MQETIRFIVWSTIFIFALAGAAILLTGCSEMKYVVKCTADINANCN